MLSPVTGPYRRVRVAVTCCAVLLAFLARPCRASEEARKAVCKSYVKQIGLAISMYGNDHDEHYPPSLDALYDQYITAKKIFACPSDRKPKTIGKDLRCSYRYVGTLSTRTDPSVIILYDRAENHQRQGRNALFYDGHVEWIPEGALHARLKRSYELVKKTPPKTKPEGYDKRIEEFYGIAIDTAKVQALLKALHSDDPVVCQQARDSLVAMASPALVPALAESAKSPKPQVRSAIVHVLGRIGGTEAKTLLREAASDEDPTVAQNAAIALTELGPPDHQLFDLLAVAAVNEATSDPDAAAAALAKAGDKRAVPGLIRMLRTGDRKSRSSAAKSLGELRDKRGVAPLLEAAKAGDLRLRLPAMVALGEIGDKSTLPSLLAFLQEPDVNVRRAAASSIGKLGDASALPALAAASEDRAVRPWAGLALARLGEGSGMKILIESLKHEDRMVRAWAAKALGVVPNEQAVPPLIAALSDDDLRVHDAVAATLGEIDDERARKALSEDPRRRLTALLEELKSRDYQTCKAAQAALAKIGEPAVPMLIQALNGPDSRGSAAAASTLSMIKDESVATRLVEVLKREGLSYQVRNYAQNALARMGEPALPVLVRALGDVDAAVASAAANALGSMRKAEAVAALTRVLHDAKGPAEIRVQAANALALSAQSGGVSLVPGFTVPSSAYRSQPGPHASMAVEALLRTLKDADAQVRFAVASALSKVATEEARQALVAGSEADDRLLRIAATEALQQACALALRRLYYPCRRYADSQRPDRLYPRKLTDLLTHRLISNAQGLRCPADKSPEKTSGGHELSYGSAFDLTDKILPKDFPRNAIMIWDDQPRHEGKRQVLHFSGRSALMAEGDFEAALDRLKALIEEHGKEHKVVKKTVVQLMEDLKSRDARTRQYAEIALAEKGEEAVPGLMEALRDKNYRVSRSAASALAKIGGESVANQLVDLLREGGRDYRLRSNVQNALRRMGTTAVPVLIEALKDSNETVRQTAASALSGSRDTRAMAALVEALGDSSSSVQSNAASSLGRMRTKAATEALLAKLEDPDLGKRRAAARGLGYTGDGSVVPPLVAALKDTDYSVRSSAASALGMLRTQEACDALIEALKGADTNLAATAARVLGGLSLRSASEALKSAAKAEARATRAAAVQGLAMAAQRSAYRSSRPGGPRNEALELVIAALADPDASVRNAARQNLSWRRIRYNRTYVKAIAGSLVASLKHENDEVCKAAVSLLAEFEDKDLPQRLLDLLAEPDERTRNGARSALTQMPQKVSFEPVRTALSGPNATIRADAASILGEMGKKEALDELKAALTDKAACVRHHAATAIAKLGGESPNLTDLLMAAMRDRHSHVRISAGQALAKRGETDAVPVFVEMLASEDAPTRLTAVKLLARAAGASADGALIKALEDDDAKVRIHAALGLGDRKVEGAVEPLIAALSDADPNVARCAVSALGKIGDEAARPHLAKIVGDKQNPVRPWAGLALYRLGEKAGLATVIDALKSDEPKLRAWAAQAIGVVGAREALPALEVALDDQDRRVREKAIDALIEVADASAAPALTKAMRVADADTCKKLVGQLAELGDLAAVPAIVEAARHYSSGLGKAIDSAFKKLGNQEIYVIGVDGTSPQNLTNHTAADTEPAWSPDGQRIAFASNREGHFEIYTMAADGSDLTRLTDSTGHNSQPAWSLDGRKIAFRSTRDGNEEIYVMNADGAEQTNLTNHSRRDSGPAWSPDGAKIAFASDRDGDFDIYTMNADGTDQKLVVYAPGEDRSPAWSSDGKRLAFSSRRDGNWEVYVMDVTGGAATNVSRSPNTDGRPYWSPDGRRVAFNPTRPDGSWVCMATADGADLSKVTVPNGTCSDPAWAPDGKKIALCGRKYVDRTSLPVLAKAAKDENRYVRCYAIVALSRCQDRSVVPVLVRALDDEYVFTRRWAAYGLGKVGDPSAASALKQALSDADEKTRGYIRTALRTLGADEPIVVCSALDPKESRVTIEEPGWVLKQIIDFPDCQAARYNPLDGLLYVAVRKRTSEGGGLYRVNADVSVTKMAAGDRIASVAVDHDSGDVFFSEDYGGVIYRVAFGSTRRVAHASGFHYGDDDPIGMAIATRGHAGGVVEPGEALVVDRGNKGPDEVWKFSAKELQRPTLVHSDVGTLVNGVDVALGRNAVYLVDTGEKGPGRIHEMAKSGDLKEISLETPIGEPVAIAVDPINGDLLVLDADGKRLVRVVPGTRALRDVLTGFSVRSDNWAGVDLTPDGTQLFITDRAAGRIYTFTRERKTCLPSLRAFAGAVMMYAAAHGGRLPPDMALLYDTLAERKPGSTRPVPPEEIKKLSCHRAQSGSGYVYLLAGTKKTLVDVKDAHGLVVMHDAPPGHDGAYHALFLDGHVESLAPERLNDLLKRAADVLEPAASFDLVPMEGAKQ